MPEIKHIYESLFFQSIKSLFILIPRKICLSLGKLAGLSFYILDKKHRSIALSNLRSVMDSDLSISKQEMIAVIKKSEKL